MKRVTILGATGSIGVSTLDVLSRHPEQFEVVALAANRRVDVMFDQCLKFDPRYAVLADETAAQVLAERLSRAGREHITVLAGDSGLQTVASLSEVDLVMAAIVGAAGLAPTLSAVRAGKKVLLANKEVLVMSGQLFMDEVRQHQVVLLPVDSEHNAIFQCLPVTQNAEVVVDHVSRLILTASGGPCRETPITELVNVTPAQACAHPNWDMGQKISVDSATMMNKGLEVIEAHWLFGVSVDCIDVVIHPQSIVHSFVSYTDGSLLAQMGHPDMRTPIAQALAWPERIDSGVAQLSPSDMADLTFDGANFQRYPCLRLAFESLERGGTSSTVLNAANEIAVQAFLNETICFTDIPTVVEDTLSNSSISEQVDLDHILECDRASRQIAQQCIAKLKH